MLSLTQRYKLPLPDKISLWQALFWFGLNRNPLKEEDYGLVDDLVYNNKGLWRTILSLNNKKKNCTMN
jgi:hypothetical protein